jgi:cytoskeleton protein RodZ
MAKGGFGQRLKREREMREVSLDELTKSTRISQRFLEALENEEWSKLPGGVFGRGFVRTIAGYLGLDEEELLGEYDLARGDLSHGVTKPDDPIPSAPAWFPALAVVLVVALIVGLFFGGRYAWRWYAARRGAQHTSALGGAAPDSPTTPAQQDAASSPTSGAVLSSPGPLPAPPDAMVSGSADAPLDLSVSTSAATRVRILADDKLLLDGELPAGVNRHFPAHDHFEVTAADSSAVLLELNHQVMRPLGPPGASGTMVLSQTDVRPAAGGNAQP